jgi:hypothetical protein
MRIVMPSLVLQGVPGGESEHDRLSQVWPRDKHVISDRIRWARQRLHPARCGDPARRTDAAAGGGGAERRAQLTSESCEFKYCRTRFTIRWAARPSPYGLTALAIA